METTARQAARRVVGDKLHKRFIETQDKELLSRICDLYKSGLSIKEVSAASGKSIGTVHRWLRQENIEIRPLSSGTKGKPWSAARRAATPAKEKKQPLVVNGREISGREIITHKSLGRKSRTGHGYVTVHTGRKSKQYEHILIAERAIGRKLNKGEVVHHINCDRTDNRPENLLICKIGYHLALHARMRRDPYWAEIERTAKSKTKTRG